MMATTTIGTVVAALGVGTAAGAHTAKDWGRRLAIAAGVPLDLPVPGQSYTFCVVKAAQA